MIVIEKLPSAKMLLGAEDATERTKESKTPVFLGCAFYEGYRQ